MLRRILGASLRTLPIACTAVAALAVASNADAQIVAPYTADADTLYLYSFDEAAGGGVCLLYTSPSPRDGLLSRMPSSA